MNLLSLFLLSFIAGCATAPNKVPLPGTFLRITEVNPSKLTSLTRQNLDHLLQVYHLSPLIFTPDVEIQTQVIPKSHPLTLNTRFAEQPQKLLASFIHEELHWWADKKKPQMGLAAKELKRLYPEKDGLFLQHMLICFLEYDALIFYLEKRDADKVIEAFISEDKIHPWIYFQVRQRFKDFDRVVTRFNLRPLQKPTKKPPLSSDKRLKNL